MVELNGKYNSAKIFTDNVDEETISQLYSLLNQEFVSGSNIRIMPDTHAGAGCVIGTTMTLSNKVCPNLVGVDIGCGMLAVKLKETEIDLLEIDSVINNYVPAGFNIHDTAIASSNVGDVLADIDLDKAYRSLGSLGGGNHFIEIDKDEDDNLWLVIHSGSRHLGVEVCDYYQKLGYENIKKSSFGDISEMKKSLIKKLTDEGKQKQISSALKKLTDDYKKTNVTIPKDLAYVEGEDFKNYIHDMKLVQEHAKINRRTMANLILSHANLHEVESFDTIHNYIDTDDMILRKGSISAKSGERVIIPMNMRDGSLICIGKGNPDWNYSAPHGAGRIMSRNEAFRNLTLSTFQESMKDIFSTSVCNDTLDEAPQVYKPMEEIIENIKDTVEIVSIIKPIYNFKAH